MTSCLGVVCVQDKKSKIRSGEAGSSSREGGSASKKPKNRSGEGGSSSRFSERVEASSNCTGNKLCYLLGATPVPPEAEPCGVCVCALVYARVCACVLPLGWSCDLRCAGDPNCRRSQRYLRWMDRLS